MTFDINKPPPSQSEIDFLVGRYKRKLSCVKFACRHSPWFLSLFVAAFLGWAAFVIFAGRGHALNALVFTTFAILLSLAFHTWLQDQRISAEEALAHCDPLAFDTHPYELHHFWVLAEQHSTVKKYSEALIMIDRSPVTGEYDAALAMIQHSEQLEASSRMRRLRSQSCNLPVTGSTPSNHSAVITSASTSSDASSCGGDSVC